MAEPKKGSKPAVPSRGVSVASAVGAGGGNPRGNPYHAPDGRFTSGGSVLDAFMPHAPLPAGASVRATPVKPHTAPLPQDRAAHKEKRRAG